MESVNSKNLIGLPVYTKSGQYLGKIFDIEIELQSQTILKYYVKSGSLLKKLFQPKLIINREQVLSLTREKMIVEDALIKEQIIMVPVDFRT